MQFIGIDIGTSSICGVAYNLPDKKIESVTHKNNASIASPHTWEKKQDPAMIIAIAREILAQFRESYGQIEAIGITGQMHGIVYVDARGQAVSPLYTWQDGRGNLIYKENDTYVDYLQHTTGYPVATGYGLVTHFYHAVNGEVPAGAVKICTIMDYLVMQLTGNTTPLTDPSNSASLGFFDTEKGVFDTGALRKAGIDESILPVTRKKVSVCGFYDTSVPVYTAIGDNQASYLGSVKDIRHSIHVTVGTSSQISLFSEEYINIPCVDTRPFPGGGFLLVGAALCGGQSFELLSNFFRDVIRFFTGRVLDKQQLYSHMTALEYDPEEEDRLRVETLFDGTRTEPWKKGSITQISRNNMDTSHMIIGFVNGISDELYQFYLAIPETLRRKKNVLVGSGNGLKKNKLIRKAFEQQFGHTMHLSPHQEEAAFGACLSAMEGHLKEVRS